MKILIIYFIPTNTFKSENWTDGFTSAIKLLENFHTIKWCNLSIDKPNSEFINSFDFLMVKSNWNWIVDKYVRALKKNIKIKKGICISGVAYPPPLKEMKFYDVLFYETDWYKMQIQKHTCIVHAFGINTTKMFPTEMEKVYDWLTIGSLHDYKRLEKFVVKPGKKAFIGEINTGNEKLLNLLLEKDVEIIQFTKYENMRSVICSSKNVYIPASIQGGGERAVLEARACNIKVTIEDDNPKLKELLTSQIYDHHYYSDQLNYGIKKCFKISLLKRFSKFLK